MRPALWGVLLAGAGVAVFVGAVVRAQPERTLSSFSTSLEGRTTNQRHNALLAVRKLDGAIIAPGEVFSFNGSVGTYSRDAGYRRAPVSYNGTLIESWGGGVCQASTTVYSAALLAGLEVVERHRHRFWPSYVAPGRDAAVAFDDIDLKLRNPYRVPVRIEAAVRGATLHVRLVSRETPEALPTVHTEVRSWVPAREFRLASQSTTRVRNQGKDGYDVATYRLWQGHRELISLDTYPPMHRIVESR